MDEIIRRTGPYIYSRFEEEEMYLKRKVNILQEENEELRAKLGKVDMPEKHIINENATILFWKDGEKTIVKKCEEDDFNPRLAFLTAFFQHYCGMSKNKANKYLASLEVEKNKENSKDKFVKVISWEKTYDCYKSLVESKFPKYTNNFKMRTYPKNGQKYKLLGETCHEESKSIKIYLIQDIWSKQVYLIDKDGTKEV